MSVEVLLEPIDLPHHSQCLTDECMYCGSSIPSLSHTLCSPRDEWVNHSLSELCPIA